MIKVLLLGAANSIHTIKWANGLASRGVEVFLVSLHQCTETLDNRVHYILLKQKAPLGYLTAAGELIKLIEFIKPDLLNAHYATGYGFMARKVGFAPTLLSVWGSDVYDFPDKSFFHRYLLKKNLEAATAVGSTSNCMSRKILDIAKNVQCFIIPFGVNECHFKASDEIKSNDEEVIIGTVKTLSYVYGIDILIMAFADAYYRMGSPKNLKLEISGSGPDLNELEKMVSDYDIKDQVCFHGYIKHEDVPKMIDRLDIYCAFSRAESFGVSILEACSSEKPVIVSDADGPAEIVLNSITGIIVPKNDIAAASEAIIKLTKDRNLRRQMGKAGRMHVLKNYTWEKSLDLMIDAYRKIYNSH